MKKFFAAMSAALLAMVFVASTAFASPPPTAPGKNPLTCFADAPATCTTNGKTATIDHSTPGVAGGAAGVYLLGYNNSFYGVRTGQVTTLSNTVSGDPLGIDPHWMIPIDSNHDGNTDYLLSVPLAGCNDGAGFVDVINDPTCTIYRGDDPLVSYPNWTSFVTANPNTYISLNDYFAFIIADGSGAPGVWTISNLKVGKPGK